MSIANLILNKSQERRKLFSQFFANESREYYLRELERLTGIPVGNIRRELNKYTDDKLFLTKKTGNLLFYRLNTSHPLYKELKKILSTEIGIEFDLRNVLSKIKNIECACIFGSFAKGIARTDSDIDLIIIGNPKRDRLADDVAKIEKQYQREINYQVYKKELFQKKKDSKNSFVLKLLKEPKIMIIGNENEI